jgi:hypothetical protein
MCKWYVETIFLVKLEAEQNIVFQKLCPGCIQQIVESHIQTKVQNCIHYVGIEAGPYPKFANKGHWTIMRQ